MKERSRNLVSFFTYFLIEANIVIPYWYD